eukprot:scaffold211_cov447-Prasinococcus_capsulatus_cf.AAC.8
MAAAPISASDERSGGPGPHAPTEHSKVALLARWLCPARRRVLRGGLYAEPHHHRCLTELRRQHAEVIFLAGDSSLDNKYWFKETVRPLDGHLLTTQRDYARACPRTRLLTWSAAGAGGQWVRECPLAAHHEEGRLLLAEPRSQASQSNGALLRELGSGGNLTE